MIDDTIKAIFFDAVGTLLFPRVPVSQTYVQFAQRHGGRVTEEDVRRSFREAFARQEERDLQENWKTDEAREQARWRAIVGDVLPFADSDACFTDLWHWFSKPAAWAVHPQAGDVLNEFAQRGITLGIASNFDSRLNNLVAAMPELANIRDHCVVSSLVGWRKPAHQFFSAVAESARCAPEHILYVGDDPRNDVHAAIAAGLQAILYDPEERTKTGVRIRQLRDLLPGCGVSS